VTDEATRLAMAICRHFEGFYSHPYLDPIGIPTIGYGTITYPDGTTVTLRDEPITREQAEMYLAHHLETEVVPALARLCPVLDEAERLAALMSWTHNLGAGNLQASTLRRRINAGAWADVPAQIRRWNRAGGVVLRGLVRRRDAEAKLVEATL
jgi:lysozyme